MCEPEDRKRTLEEAEAATTSQDVGDDDNHSSEAEAGNSASQDVSDKNHSEAEATTASEDVVGGEIDNEHNDESVADKEASQEKEKEEEEEPSRCRRICSRLTEFYWNNEFIILVVAAILLARAYPPLGAVYLAPDITATWIAVCFIFLMAGLGLKTEEFSKAFQQIYFNAFVQIYNFGVVSAVVYGVSRLLALGNILSQDLADGMTITACLPMTINMVLVLTKASGGDEAAAIFNAAFGNMIGVFLSPVLILGYLGVTGEINLVNVFYKLALRVLLPVIVGQILQKTSKAVVDFVKRNKKHFKRAQQYALVFIVYTVFCRTFYDGNSSSSVGDIFLMILFIFILLTGLMVLAWYCLRLLFRGKPKLRVMGLFGCTHKTVAMGVPLITAIYSDNPSIGLYTLPLLIWHPMQLIIGTALAPRLSAFVERENERLGITDDDDDEEEQGQGAIEADEEQGEGANEADEEQGEGVAGASDEQDRPQEDKEIPTRFASVYLPR